MNDEGRDELNIEHYKGRNIVSKLMSYCYNEGIATTILRALGTIRSFVASSQIIFIYAKSCSEDDEIFTPAINTKIEELGIEALAELDALMYHPVDRIRRRFERQDRCFIAKVDDAIICYAWIVPGKTSSDNNTLEDNQFYVYNVRTIRKMRGKGLYPFMLTALCSLLAKEGYTEALIRVEKKNKASVKGIEKAGFSLRRRVERKIRFGMERETIDTHISHTE